MFFTSTLLLGLLAGAPDHACPLPVAIEQQAPAGTQDPVVPEGAGILSDPAPDPQLVAAMNRYREFVASPERLNELKNISFHYKRIDIEKDAEGESREKVVEDLRVIVKLASNFADWKVRIEAEAQGQELALVGTPAGDGFGMLGGVLQGHPRYKQAAEKNAYIWSVFFLRWLNPDSPLLFQASYDGRRETVKDRPMDRIMLRRSDPSTGEVLEAWRLYQDATTGAPLKLETFNAELFTVVMEQDYVGFFEVDGIRFPKRCEILDAQGQKIGVMEFDSFEIDADLEEDLFSRPNA